MSVTPDRDPAVSRALALDAGRLLLTGPPGSGKTRTLLERYARLVEGGADPDRVLLLVLNRRAARDARERLAARLARSLPSIGVHTVHSFALRVLGRRHAELSFSEPPQVLSAAEQYAVVRELLRHQPRGRWPRLGHLLDLPGFAREIADVLLRAQERLLDPDELEARARRAGRAEYLEVARFYREYLDVTGQAHQVDFAGLLHGAAALLQRGLGEEDRVDHLLVDDYEDATPAAEAIVCALASAAASVVVAADPGGGVFSFRGGSLEPLRRIDQRLAPIERVSLSGGRLDSAALRALDDPEAPPAPPPPGLEARVCAHPGEEADAIAHELLRARVDDDVPWERMAVIVRRYGEYLTALRHALARHGVPHVVVEEANAVAAEPAVRPIVALLRYALFPERRADLLEPLLASPVGGLDPATLRRARREARRRQLTLAALASSEPPDGLPEEVAGPLRRFRALTEELAVRAARGDPDRVFFWLWSRLPWADRLVAEERHRDLDAIAAFADILARFAARRPGARMADFLESLEAAEFGPDPWTLPEERRPSAVRVLSAHGAHGQEFDVVLVAGCVEGEFPAPVRAAPLVDIEALEALRSPAERVRAALAEERRLFRLAVTRARRRTLLFASDRAGAARPRAPSRYLARLGLVPVPAQADGAATPTSLRAIEAALRRRLADSTRPAAERLAALAVLGPAGARPEEWWGGRDWTDPGEPLYAAELRTSYSRLSDMEACGLKYLYQVEMGLDPEQSYQMWLGAVIHRIIDEVQRGEVPREEGPVLARLDELWDPERFPSRAVEHRRRLDAEDMLRRWLVGEQAEVERSEVPFSYRLGAAEIRGKIDAIFRNANGHLRLVDYKTGRWAPSSEEVQEDLQLAAYYLATLHDEDLRRLGRTGYLQLAYLGKPKGDGGFTRLGFPPRDGYREWAESAIAALVERIRSEDFAPNPEADCRFCPFKIICPLWPEGAEAVR
jgi:superfamily I DNA/RNA helicase/RecB family exonuclease